MIRSVVFASLQYGMTAAFVSTELKSILCEIKERYLQLVVSDIDEEGYLLDYYKGYYVLGKITKHVDGTIYENRSTAVYHLYFMDREDVVDIQLNIKEGYFPEFISEPDDEFLFAEEMSFQLFEGSLDDEEDILLQNIERGYIQIFELLQEKISINIQNDMFSNREIFYYFIRSFDIDFLSRSDIRIGCLKLIFGMQKEENQRSCLSICKEDDQARIKLTDFFNKDMKEPYVHLLLMKNYYRLYFDEQHHLWTALNEILIRNKKENFDECIKTSEEFISMLSSFFQKYKEEGRKKKRRLILKKVKRVDKDLKKIQRILRKIVKEEREIRDLSE